MDWIGLDWIGLDWIGLIGLDWIGLDWIEIHTGVEKATFSKSPLHAPPISHSVSIFLVIDSITLARSLDRSIDVRHGTTSEPTEIAATASLVLRHEHRDLRELLARQSRSSLGIIKGTRDPGIGLLNLGVFLA